MIEAQAVDPPAGVTIRLRITADGTASVIYLCRRCLAELGAVAGKVLDAGA